MMAEKYNLRWHTYTDHLQKMLKEMKEEFTDVTLICEDKQRIRAHRNILAGCSPVFKSIFQIEDVQNPIIFLRGINHADMESILQFIYLGKASFYQDRMYEFLQAARSLEIAELSTVAPESLNSTTDDYDRPPGEADDENEIEGKLEEVLEAVKVRTISKSTGQSSGSIKCQECEKTFSGRNRNQKLSRHVDAIHRGIKYKCKQCPKEYTQTEHLKKHVEAIHGGIKYRCQQCPKEYNQSENLKTHVKITHEGQKFLCHHCSVTFGRKENLYSHIRKHNSTITIPGSFQCQECEKTFSENYNLKRHVDIIHGGIKYKCQQCPKVYTSNENLKIHVKNTHEGLGFPCN